MLYTVLCLSLLVLCNQCFALQVSASPQLRPLHKLNLEPQITVSGLSSGAYMAVQMHVALSKTVNGSAVFAGGPFYCAESNVEIAQFRCMSTTFGPPPPTAKLVAVTNTDFSLGFVDDPVHLKHSPVYVFSGTKDSVVEQSVGKALVSYYTAFGANVTSEFSIAAEHCMPTLSFGESCTKLGSPYIGNCGFDGAGQALQTLFPTGLNTPADSHRRVAQNGQNLFAFDQTPYFAGVLTSLDTTGYIYIPTACNGTNANVTCSLHISFHGCEQGLDAIGNQYATSTGYNAWAEANNIVVLYPYATTSSIVPLNPKGCWDWWAYTNVYYGTKQGVQVQFVRALAKAVGVTLE